MLKLAQLFMIALLAVSCTKEPEPKPTTPLIIKSTNGDVRFSVEVANTPDELQTGLMHRSSLAFNNGMVFNIYPVRPTAMWMKNTKIPLDMLFVAPDGSISMIKENAQPMSEDMIISRDPVRLVIELNAGQVRRNQIKVGDKVTHMLLNSMLDTKTPGPEAETNVPQAAAPKADIAVPELKIEQPSVQEQQTDKTPSTSKTESAPLKAPQTDKSIPDIKAETAKSEAPAFAAPQPAPEAPKLPIPAPAM